MRTQDFKALRELPVEQQLDFCDAYLILFGEEKDLCFRQKRVVKKLNRIRKKLLTKMKEYDTIKRKKAR